MSREEDLLKHGFAMEVVSAAEVERGLREDIETPKAFLESHAEKIDRLSRCGPVKTGKALLARVKAEKAQERSSEGSAKGRGIE